MKASLFYLPSIGSRAEIEAGMAGMNPHFYQRMLKELTEQIKLGDALGRVIHALQLGGVLGAGHQLLREGCH